jgi:hypothetical protein
LSYPELIVFFDTTFHQIENIDVPYAEQLLVQLGNEYRSSTTMNGDDTLQSNTGSLLDHSKGLLIKWYFIISET